ncbi:MAG TPA: plasmid transfer protein [Sphingobacterium sp.]|nr:plasmid transfer protein [Sphingobacterium sp.]
MWHRIMLWTAIAVLFFAWPINAFSQPGINEFYSATGEMHRWYFSFADLVLVIGAISWITGGLGNYAKRESGNNHHIDAQVMRWLFSCIFLTLVGACPKALSGTS